MGEATIIEVFREEAREILQNLEVDLISLEEEGGPDVINRLFRAFHTLKGSSGIAGFDSVSEFTHAVESRLDKVRSGSEKVTRGLVDMLLLSLDWVREALFGNGEDSARKGILIDKLKTMDLSVPEKCDAVPAESPVRYHRISITFREDIFMFGLDPLLILEDLMQCGTFCEFVVRRQKVPPLSSIDPVNCYLSWVIVLKTEKSADEIGAVFLFVKDDNDIRIDDI
ncbi:MAG TPA: Hpt domain-containing protein, partial [Spirochaetota bacterium]